MTVEEFARELTMFADDLNMIPTEEEIVEDEVRLIIEKVDNLELADFYEYLDEEIEEYGEDDFRFYPTRAEQALEFRHWLERYEADRT